MNQPIKESALAGIAILMGMLFMLGDLAAQQEEKRRTIRGGRMSEPNPRKTGGDDPLSDSSRAKGGRPDSPFSQSPGRGAGDGEEPGVDDPFMDDSRDGEGSEGDDPFMGEPGGGAGDGEESEDDDPFLDDPNGGGLGGGIDGGVPDDPFPTAPRTGKNTEVDDPFMSEPGGGVSQVIVYGESGDGFCAKIKMHLEANEVGYIFRDIEKDAEARREMEDRLVKAGEAGGLPPITDFQGFLIVGYNFGLLDGLIQGMKNGQAGAPSEGPGGDDPFMEEEPNGGSTPSDGPESDASFMVKPGGDEEVPEEWRAFKYPEIVVVDSDKGKTRGSALVHKLIPDLEAFIQKITLGVCQTLYKNAEEVPVFEQLTFQLEHYDGIAGKSGHPPKIRIDFSTKYLETQHAKVGDDAIAYEIAGVNWHELTHGYQHVPRNAGAYRRGTDHYGFIEGTADAVRILAGYHKTRAPQPGGHWTDGYTTSGFFITWLMKNRDPDFLYKLNQSCKTIDPWTWDKACKSIFGRTASVSRLWDEYQRDLKSGFTEEEPKDGGDPPEK